MSKSVLTNTDLLNNEDKDLCMRIYNCVPVISFSCISTVDLSLELKGHGPEQRNQ